MVWERNTKIYLPGAFGDNIMQLPFALSAAGMADGEFRPELELYMDISQCHWERGNAEREAMAERVLGWQMDLLRMQPYVQDVHYRRFWDREWLKNEGVIDTNFQRTTPKIDMTRGDICWRNCSQWRCLSYFDTGKQWLFLPDDKKYEKFRGKIILSATPRYANNFVSWKCLEKHKKHILFVGLESDREGLYWRSHIHFDFYKTTSFVDLAQAIRHSAFFVGTQSFPACLAEALKVPRIFVQATNVPDLIPRGGTGNAVIDESDLENTLEMYVCEFLSDLV